MMKLSTMKKVMATVDDQWQSKYAEEILDRWGYDQGKYYCLRASANFIFVFQKNGHRYFLRFNDACEREVATIEAEINILLYLQSQSANIAAPVMSLSDRYVETVETQIGTFHAVVFEALEGDHLDFEELKRQDFYVWGNALGKLHKVLKNIPNEYRQGRVSWQDHLKAVKELLPESETAAKAELEQVNHLAAGLKISKEDYGLIHYDFELDNLVMTNDQVGILDFDDCANYWFVADIAYALRDLFEAEIDMENQNFIEFMAGYKEEVDVDHGLLEQLPLFMRIHNVVTFAKLYRSVDIAESPDNPEWLNGLINKFKVKMDFYRDSFERNILNVK